MKSSLVVLLVVLGMLTFGACAFAASTPEQMLDKIHWLGQAGVKIEAGDKIIYIDPLQLTKEDQADIVLITHAHDDHLSLADITKIAKPETVFIAPQNCVEKLAGQFKNKVTTLVPGASTEIGAIKIEAVPAYNITKTKFHPKENQWVGYVLTIDGVKIYHAGDTERIPEMQKIACDIALLPLGQTYTMNTVQDAADAAVDVKAKIAIPIHYGMYEGKAEDADAFSKLLKDKVTVVIKTKE
jgi:L-ascorbate metabolism protein UlaG (beta-lactamase superfamily)